MGEKHSADSPYTLGKQGLFIDEEVQRLIDSFAYCFKVKVTIFSTRIEEMIVGLQNPGSAYCRLIQGSLGLRYRCCHQDKLMCERCERQDKTIVYNCHGGLSEIVVPIKVDGMLIGYGICGQFLTAYRLPEEILHAWIKAGFCADDIKNVYRDGPFLQAETLDNMCKLFSMMLDFIVTRKYVSVRRPGLAEQVSILMSISKNRLPLTMLPPR